MARNQEGRSGRTIPVRRQKGQKVREVWLVDFQEIIKIVARNGNLLPDVIF